MSHDHDHDHDSHGHDHSHGHGDLTDVSAPLSVTINPEARVNAARTGAPFPAFGVGVWTTIAIQIINEGYVTGPLAIVARPVPGIELDLPQHTLTGRNQELWMRVKFDAPAVVDIELRFFALGSLGGLADHNTVSFIARCTGEAPGGPADHAGNGHAHHDHGAHDDHGVHHDHDHDHAHA